MIALRPLKSTSARRSSPSFDTDFVSSSIVSAAENTMDQVMQFVEPSRQFVKDSIRLVKRCTKPDRKEFQKIAMATAIGFAIMGFIGFFVKLIHIPINNIIV
ncbi:Protein transport protein Sec61 subunit gamma [Scophthalmus maximus]|uniref:Protein transport protein Sec61 subunit gamma n=1 Tax=Scophthalmus maximus TaxID=52904 RepID=A0A2U9CW56_SCOMX|nr:Protein transport protein Sec61 subunit gamma [Scophthalmus maximus]